MNRKTVLTGDRATGQLHIGHYAGSLRNRLSLQEDHEQFLLVADCQALTDNVRDPAKVRKAAIDIVIDYLAIGIDPSRTTICLQSGLPALAELSMLYMNLVSVARLERNPTIKEEIAARGFERDVPAGFLCYPAAQAADITGFDAEIVPTGADQAPLIEQCNEIVRKVNAITGQDTLREARARIPEAGRLPAIDGSGKMSKSSGTAILLDASPETIKASVMAMFTDPGHLRVADPGRVEGNVVFAYLDAFHPDKDAVNAMKEHYRKGGLGDMRIKRDLDEVLQEMIRPIRERRAELLRDPEFALSVLREGTARARERTGAVRDRVFSQMGFSAL